MIYKDHPIVLPLSILIFSTNKMSNWTILSESTSCKIHKKFISFYEDIIIFQTPTWKCYVSNYRFLTDYDIYCMAVMIEKNLLLQRSFLAMSTLYRLDDFLYICEYTKSTRQSKLNISKKIANIYASHCECIGSEKLWNLYKTASTKLHKAVGSDVTWCKPLQQYVCEEVDFENSNNLHVCK